MGSQPRSQRACRFLSSRPTLSRNFCCQKTSRDFGEYANLQPGCRCQKHPCTKMTFRLVRRTMSGRPGRSLEWRRYPMPRLRRARLTTSSGPVFLLRIRLMLALRRSGVILSTISRFLISHLMDGSVLRAATVAEPRIAVEHVLIPVVRDVTGTWR